MALAAAGCAGDYAREELSQDGTEARNIRHMVEALRDAPTDEELAAVIEKQLIALDSRNADRRKMTAAVLARMASAEEVEFLLFDRYGDSVYRVNLRLRWEQGVENISMLLSPDEQGDLRWVSPN